MKCVLPSEVISAHRTLFQDLQRVGEARLAEHLEGEDMIRYALRLKKMLESHMSTLSRDELDFVRGRFQANWTFDAEAC